MITIPKKVEYSALLISKLAENDGKTMSLREVSKKTLLPYRFLGQLASQLKKGGLLESKEGIGGGYRLTGEWRDRTMYDVIVILGEDKHLVKCLAKSGECRRLKTCTMRNLWKGIEDGLAANLRQLKLGSF